MDTFSRHNPPRRQLKFQDPDGVLQVWAYFHHVDNNNDVDYNKYIILSGDGKGQTEALIDLTPSTWSEPVAAGEYHCTQVEALSVSGEQNISTKEERPKLGELSFRYEYPTGMYADIGNHNS
jgi:hypothetical protein